MSTITVLRPTAAEQTMQPASINENSLRSLAACINESAQATSPTTTTTVSRATRVATGDEKADTAGEKRETG